MLIDIVEKALFPAQINTSAFKAFMRENMTARKAVAVHYLGEECGESASCLTTSAPKVVSIGHRVVVVPGVSEM
jgi:hypothetical protein